MYVNVANKKKQQSILAKFKQFCILHCKSFLDEKLDGLFGKA